MATLRKGKWKPVEEDLRDFCEALYALICKIAGFFIEDQEVRKEVIQYTCVRIIRHRHKLFQWEDYQRFGYLLKAVVRNHWRVLRQNSRFLLVGDREDEDGELHNPFEEIPDETSEPHRALVEKLEEEFLLMVREMAEEVLTEDQYDIFVLRLEGKLFKEIGDLLDRSEVACRKSWHQITRKLALAAQKRGLI